MTFHRDETASALPFPNYTALPSLTIRHTLEPTPFKRGVKLAVYVYSKPSDFLFRETVRTTWGQQSALREANAQLVFPIGLTSDVQVTSQIQNESIANGDIMQGNFVDNYTNLTYKGMMMVQSFARQFNQPEHLLKLDSDVFPHLSLLNEMLLSQPPSDMLLLCKFHWRSLVLRSGGPCGKWCIPVDDYPNKLYPPYCWGSFYVMSRALVSEINRQQSRVPAWWVSDVHLTGHLPLRIEQQTLTNKREIHRMDVKEFTESSTDKVFERLRQSPHRLMFGLVGSTNDTVRAWSVLREVDNTLQS